MSIKMKALEKKVAAALSERPSMREPKKAPEPKTPYYHNVVFNGGFRK